MNLVELDHALRQLRLSGMASSLEARLVQAQAEQLPPIDLVSTLVADELLRRQDRLLDRRIKQAAFRVLEFVPLTPDVPTHGNALLVRSS